MIRRPKGETPKIGKTNLIAPLMFSNLSQFIAIKIYIALHLVK